MAGSENKGESFADMFARGAVPLAKQRKLSVGDEVEGVIGHVGPDSVFVDLGANQQAFFERHELKESAPDLQLVAGEKIKGWVVETEGGIKLAKRFGRSGGANSPDRFRPAFESGVPVEGKVSVINKGGAEVDLGGVRGFCPLSQLDNSYVQDPASFVGRTLSFVITKLDDRDVVLSRRQLLDREAKEGRTKLLSTLAIGSTVKGLITQVREFGAFVDLGGIQGLVPSRELSHDRVRAEDVVKVGDAVEVQVKSIETKPAEGKKPERVEITLSLKALATDPWTAIATIAPPGRVVAGQVSRLAEFGAFVRLGSGIEGLLHIGELGAKVKHPKDALEIGQSLLVRVISVDAGKKRVALGLASEGATVGAEDRGASIVVGQLVAAVVEKVETYGVVVQIAGSKGRSGRATIPNIETGTKQGADLRKEFPVGMNVTAKVIEGGDRVRLSIKQAREDAERADYDSYKSAQPSGPMGSFGDLLKKAQKKKK